MFNFERLNRTCHGNKILKKTSEEAAKSETDFMFSILHCEEYEKRTLYATDKEK